MVDTRLQRVSLRDQAYTAIRSSILRGEFLPGVRLRETDLAERLGVSRAPVKEALLRLEHEGYVVSNPAGRAVRRFEAAEIEEICEVRITLEGMAVQLAAANPEPEKEQRLTDRLSLFGRAIALHDAEEFSVKDFAFHREIWGLSANAHLSKALECIAASAFLLIVEFTRHGEAGWDAIYTQHEQIANAVVGGDAQAAQDAMAAHLRHSASVCTAAVATEHD